jgi:hypothetical protein
MKKKPKSSEQKPPAATGTSLNWDMGIKILAVLLSAATLGFGIYQYVLKPRVDASAVERQRKRELYDQAMASAAAFANATTQDEANKARKDFWDLYYGKLSAVESKEVKKAMQDFGGAVKSWEGFNDPSDFTEPADYQYTPEGGKTTTIRDMSYNLANVCRADLEAQSK